MATGLRERYLAQTSVSLQNSTPSLAQQLRVNLRQMQDSSGNTNQSTQGEYCPACGSTRVESRTVIDLGKAKDHPKRLSAVMVSETSSRPSELVISKCQTCSRSRKMPLQVTKAKSSEQPSVKPSDVSMNGPRNAKEHDSRIQKTSGKKRAKERKSRAGFQTLLGKASDNSQRANTFDLMDFMSSRN